MTINYKLLLGACCLAFLTINPSVSAADQAKESATVAKQAASSSERSTKQVTTISQRSTKLETSSGERSTKQVTTISQRSTKLVTPETLVAATTPAPPPPVKVPTATVWTEIGTNNALTVSYDEKGLKYDKRSGIITTWIRWDYLGTGPQGAKTIYLKSRYDVRLRTYADEEKIMVDAKGVAVQAEVADTSWNNISTATMGEDIIKALQKFLLSN